MFDYSALAVFGLCCMFCSLEPKLFLLQYTSLDFPLSVFKTESCKLQSKLQNNQLKSVFLQNISAHRFLSFFSNLLYRFLRMRGQR